MLFLILEQLGAEGAARVHVIEARRPGIVISPIAGRRKGCLLGFRPRQACWQPPPQVRIGSLDQYIARLSTRTGRQSLASLDGVARYARCKHGTVEPAGLPGRTKRVGRPHQRAREFPQRAWQFRGDSSASCCRRRQVGPELRQLVQRGSLAGNAFRMGFLDTVNGLPGGDAEGRCRAKTNRRAYGRHPAYEPPVGRLAFAFTLDAGHFHRAVVLDEELRGVLDAVFKQRFDEGLAQLPSQNLPEQEVALPLRLREKLVGRRLLGKCGRLLLEILQVDRQTLAHVGLDHQQDAMAISCAPVGNLRKRKACIAGIRRQLLQRSECLQLLRQRQRCLCTISPWPENFPRALEIYLGLQIDARLSHQILDVVERVVGIRAAVRHDNDFRSFRKQRVRACVLEMPPIGQKPVRALLALEDGQHFIEQSPRLRQKANAFRICMARTLGLAPPIPQAKSRKGGQGGDASPRELPQAWGHGCARYGRPGAERHRGPAFQRHPSVLRHLHRAAGRNGQRQPPTILIEELPPRIVGLIDANIDQVNWPAAVLRLVCLQAHIVVRPHIVD